MTGVTHWPFKRMNAGKLRAMTLAASPRSTAKASFWEDCSKGLERLRRYSL
jgi:hypothetical protein